MTLTQRIDALMAEADAHIRRAETLTDATERTAATTAANDCMERAEKLTDQSQSGAADPQLESLIRRADLGEIVNAVMDNRATTGAAAELQADRGLAANQVPLAMFQARALTAAPGNVGVNEQPIIPGVFPTSVAAFLGVDMPTVGVGEAVFPVITTNAAVEALAESAEGTETDGTFSGDKLAPGRLQASFRYSAEDRARFAGMDQSLRDNLSMALSDALDKRVIAGAEGLLTGVKLANNNVNAVTTFANYISNLAMGRVDGTYASTTADLRIVVGAGTYAHAGSQYRATESDRTALDRLMALTGGVRVSAHVPGVNANKQNAVVRLGMRRDMVAPLWDGVTIIADPYTQAAKGEHILTAVLMHAVKILRTGGFYKQQTQHA